MIDTIVLTLNQNQFDITNHERFSPSTLGLYQAPYYRFGANGFCKCSQNPSKQDMISGNYKPRLTITKRMKGTSFAIILKIEFSIPKLLYGNNFVEVIDSDFENILRLLKDKLQKMGVDTSVSRLKTAEVSSVHFSRNIILEDFMTTSMIINELKKINLSKRLDLSNTDFRNEGHILHYHANSFEVVFYDKMKDMQQSLTSDKRAIENDNCIQLDLFKTLQKKKRLQVLRMEVRLGNKTKIKSLLASLNIPALLTFDRLFKQAISKKVLLHYWQKTTEDLILFSHDGNKPEDLFNKIMTANKGLKTGKALSVLSGLLLINSIGIRGFRALLSSYCSERTWQRISGNMKRINLPTGFKHLAINYVKTVLSEYRPITMKDFNETQRT